MVEPTKRTVSVLEPVADPPETSGLLAPRPDELRGRTIGLLDNGQVNAGTFLGRVGELLVEQSGAGSVVHRRKDFWTNQASTALIDELAATCDVVVTGWGS